MMNSRRKNSVGVCRSVRSAVDGRGGRRGVTIIAVTAGTVTQREATRCRTPVSSTPPIHCKSRPSRPTPRSFRGHGRRAEIDAKMVVAAPAGIDEAMVFNPYTSERQDAWGGAHDAVAGGPARPDAGTPLTLPSGMGRRSRA